MKNFKSLIAVLSLATVLVSSCGEKYPDVIKPLYPGFNTVNGKSISSTVLGQSVDYTLLVPKTYDASKKYPVIYLLHGNGEDHSAWTSNTTQLAYELSQSIIRQEMPEVIVAMPNAFGSYYLNKDEYKKMMQTDNGMDYETFFFTEFMREVEFTYNCGGSRDARAIAGNSMGAFGSLYYGLKYPDTFSFVYAMSPDITGDLSERAQNANPKELPVISISVGEQDAASSKLSLNFYNDLKNHEIESVFSTWQGRGDWAFWSECIPLACSQIGSIFLKNFPKFEIESK